MYNDYLQNIIISYSLNVIICPRIDYIYANWYLYIRNFLYDILCQHEFDRHPCPCCNANIHVTPLCAHSMGSLDSLQSVLWSPGVKIPWIHVPQVGLLRDISKNQHYHKALFKNKELKPLGYWDQFHMIFSLKFQNFNFQSQIYHDEISNSSSWTCFCFNRLHWGGSRLGLYHIQITISNWAFDIYSFRLSDAFMHQ